jgi:hypothetical protein
MDRKSHKEDRGSHKAEIEAVTKKDRRGHKEETKGVMYKEETN